MVHTTLNRIYSLSPSDKLWEHLLKCLGKTQPDDDALDLLHILYSAGLYPALWCCQSLPDFDKYWRLYAVWCARQVKYSMFFKEGIIAINVAERFANGQATQAEFEEMRATMERMASKASNQNYSEASVKAAAATTEKVAGLAAREAAYSAASAASHYVGKKAQYSVPVSSSEIENYCEGNAAYDFARQSAFKSAMEAQEKEFIRLVMSLK